MRPPGKSSESKGTSVLAVVTLLLTLLAAFYAVAIHGKIIDRRYTGFTLDGECRIKNLETSHGEISVGDRLTTWRQRDNSGSVTSVFGWIKTTERLDYGRVDLVFQKKDSTSVTVPWEIRRPPVWPKLGYTLLPLIVCIIALVLLLQRRREGEIYYLMVITLGATYILALSYTNLDAIAASPFYLISFLVWNVLAPPSLLLFFLHYPYKKRGATLPFSALMYLPALISFVVTSFLYVRFYFAPTPHNQETLLFVGRLLIPGTNFLYGLGMVWAIFHSLFRGPSYERPRMILV
ncbi:hypothetical protein KKF84_05180, partial [Myxococcota bacterium]|nr:hypothetical protein [Myxococcota bacterium]